MNTLVDCIVKPRQTWVTPWPSHLTVVVFSNTLMIYHLLQVVLQHVSHFLPALRLNWLHWSGMTANVPKCMAMAIKASSMWEALWSQAQAQRGSMQSLTLAKAHSTSLEPLFASIVLQLKPEMHVLLVKLSSLLEKVDATLASRQQKLKLFKFVACPCFTWDLSVNSFSLSWLKTKLQPLANMYAKKWSGLANSADTGCMFVPVQGARWTITLPYHHVQEVASHKGSCIHLTPYSQSHSQPVIQRGGSTCKTSLYAFSGSHPSNERQTRSLLQLSSYAQGPRRKWMLYGRWQMPSPQYHPHHPESTIKRQYSKAPRLWSSVILSLPERVFKFALNSVTSWYSATKCQSTLCMGEASYGTLQPLWTMAVPRSTTCTKIIQCLSICSWEEMI